MKQIALILVPAIVAFGALAFWFTRRQAVAAPSENRTLLSRDGTMIAFTKRGSGPPLIIVDGAFCYRENGPATELASLLAQHFTVFTYDRRGRGESGDTAPYAVKREIEDLQAIANEAGAPPFVLGVSSGGALILQAVAGGVAVKKIALYEPPYVKIGNAIPTEVVKARLQTFVSAGDRAGAVSYFLTDIYGAPRAFVFAMPLLMPNAWRRNKSVANTLLYDLTILDDRSVLHERSSAISIPTLVVGGEKSPKELHDAVVNVTSALPIAQSRFLNGQDHNISSQALAPVLVEFFGSK